MNVLVFNIETIPDIEGGQAIFDLQGLDDNSTAKAMLHMHQQKTGSDSLPLYLHKIIAISIVYRGMGDDMGKMVAVKSLGDTTSSEADLLRLLFAEIEERTPTLVSWNGSGFDLPVIHYRALKHNISAPVYWHVYWKKGSNNSAFREDNYLSRHHERHTDLKDVLASYNHNASAPLDHIAKLLGFPGEVASIKGSGWDAYQSGNLKNIRYHGETNVLNTYLVYLRYQLMRGEINADDLEKEFNLLREVLDNPTNKEGVPHLLDFLKAWA
ncbi:MAG TPA: 3'-5' exonuclease [Leucothrix sp.]|nr:3'-5' exonuclease [Leucothrix sp.]